MLKHSSVRYVLLFTALALLLLVVPAALAQAPSSPTSAGGVTPYIVSNPGPGGNVTCAQLGYEQSSARVNYNSGVFDAAFPAGITVNTDGTYVSWSSTFPIGAVIVKGSNEANIYEYIPGRTSDSGLASPPNNSGNPAGLSNLTFCWNLPLTVTKTANTSFTRTYQWSISKTVTPSVHNLNVGQSANSNYTVTVNQTGFTDSGWAVSGTIAVSNPNTSTAANITSVTDILPDGSSASVNCGVSFPYSLPAGQTLNCTYSGTLGSGTGGTNTATAATNNKVPGGSGTAPVVFNNPTTEVNKSVTVVDNFNQTGDVSLGSNSGSPFNYSRSFTCSAPGTTIYPNTARIVETGQEASASVTVNCTEPAPVCVGETAWAAGSRYINRGNWATYTPYAAGSTVTLFAGQTLNAGTVNFSAVSGGQVTITITLNSGWQFAPVAENVKIQDYASAPSGNPSPGLFAHKGTAAGSPFSITVPANNFYGVHVDVQRCS